MKFKVGDKVHPLRMIPVSNKQMMFESESGTVISISICEDGNYMLTVKRNRDGVIFKGKEYLWEHC